MISKRFVTKEKDLHNQEENHHNQKVCATTKRSSQHDQEKSHHGHGRIST
jgi:hypothetical protein